MGQTTGIADFKYGTETLQMWYKAVGDPLSNSERPLIVIHGGPGMTHNYMLLLENMFHREGIPIIFYDQLGNGESSYCDNVPDTFWNIETFLNELDNLIKHHGISVNFDLLGHSWGGKLFKSKRSADVNSSEGLLAASYAASRKPSGFKHLIISNATADMKLLEKGLNNLLDSYPADFSRMISKHEEEGTMNSIEYKEAISEFMANHMCVLKPWPAELKTSILAANARPEIIESMYNMFFRELCW